MEKSSWVAGRDARPTLKNLLAHTAFQGPGVSKSAIRAPSNVLPRFRTL